MDGEKRVRGGGFTRQIASYFAVMLVPVILTAVLSYQSFSSKSRQAMEERVWLSLQSSIQSVDKSIDIAQNACISLFIDQRVKNHLRPIAESTRDDRLEQILIHQQITALTNLTGGIAESMFIYLDDQHVFSDGLYSFNDYFTKICKYEAYDVAFWRDLRANLRFLTILPATDMTRHPQSKRRVVPVAYRSMIGTHDTVSVVTLSVTNIGATIRSGMITSDTRMHLVDADGGLILSELSDDEVAALSQEQTTIRVDGATYAVLSASSQTNGWQYTLLVPMEQITALSADTLWIFASMIVAFIFASILGFYFFRRISRPIHKMYTALDTHEVGQGMPNLEEVSRRVSFVLSDYYEAHEEKASMQQNYIDMSLFQLLSGRELHNAELLVSLLKREFNFESPLYQCAVLRIGYDWSGEPLQDTERLNMQINLQSDLLAYLTQEVPCCILEYRDNEYVFIINCSQEEAEKVYVLFENLIERLRERSSIASAHICLVQDGEALTGLGRAFQQAMETLAGIPGAERWFIGYANKPSAEVTIRYTLRDEMRLMTALRSGSQERVFAQLNALLQSSEINNSQQKEGLIHDLFITAMRFLAERNETLPDRNAYQGLRTEVDLQGGLQAKQALLMRLYEDLLQTTRQPASDSSLTTNIIQYVQENYASDLYLERIAEEMGLSVKHISRVFKSKTGQNLSDYINYVRIERVKELLIGTELSISEISAIVGIHSRTTFLRIFRKLEGVTPSEYRELACGKEQETEKEKPYADR